MTELAIIVEAVGNLTLAVVMLGYVLPRLRRGGVVEVIPATIAVAMFNVTNVLYALFYGQRQVDWMPDWLAYDTTLEQVTKGVQITSMYALPAAVVVASYRLFIDRSREQ